MRLINSADYRQLGSTGLLVSPIGLGTVKFGRNTNVKYPETFSIPNDKQLQSLLDTAHALGINLIDTAPAYGNSEQRVGSLLKDQRHQWHIVTKTGEYFKNGESHFDFSKQAIRSSVESSLKRLQTDYIDLLLLHSNGDDENILKRSDAISELQHLKRAGYIRHFGMSTKTVTGGMLALEYVDVIMVELNETDTSQAAVIEAAIMKNKGVLIKKALSSGHIKNTAQAVNFATRYAGVHSVILGTINEAHLKDNVASIINTQQATN